AVLEFSLCFLPCLTVRCFERSRAEHVRNEIAGLLRKDQITALQLIDRQRVWLRRAQGRRRHTAGDRKSCGARQQRTSCCHRNSPPKRCSSLLPDGSARSGGVPWLGRPYPAHFTPFWSAGYRKTIKLVARTRALGLRSQLVRTGLRDDI